MFQGRKRRFSRRQTPVVGAVVDPTVELAGVLDRQRRADALVGSTTASATGRRRDGFSAGA